MHKPTLGCDRWGIELPRLSVSLKSGNQVTPSKKETLVTAIPSPSASAQNACCERVSHGSAHPERKASVCSLGDLELLGIMGLTTISYLYQGSDCTRCGQDGVVLLAECTDTERDLTVYLRDGAE